MRLAEVSHSNHPQVPHEVGKRAYADVWDNPNHVGRVDGLRTAVGGDGRCAQRSVDSG